MIKILLPEDNPNWIQIKNIYWKMVMASTPFLYEDYKILYHDYLKMKFPDIYGQNHKDTKNRKTKAQEAKKLIFQANNELANYLYKGHGSDNDFHVNIDSLYVLMMTMMDDKSLEEKEIQFEPMPDSKHDPNKLSQRLLREVFCYNDKFAKSPDIFKLVDLLNVPVCPYCNRQFITTIQTKKMRQNQLDHYRNKAYYPWFALSLHNLVPCCSFCNKRKGSIKELPLYPYKEQFGLDVNFSVHPYKLESIVGSGDSGFAVKIEKKRSLSQDEEKRITQSIELFGLQELYNTHQEYIAHIFEQRYIFNDAYLSSLMDAFKADTRFPDIINSTDDLRNLLYMKAIQESDWGKTPLAKLTHDIDEQLKELSEE